MNIESHAKQYQVISYRISLLIWLIGCGAVVWSFYVFISLVSKRPDLWYLLFILPFQLYVLLSLYFIIGRFRLFISPDGIKFQFWAYDVFSTWKDVEKIEKGPWQNRLVLKEPLVKKWKYAWLVSLPNSFQARHIPFGRFTWSRFRELESEVKKYAPHLFTQ